MSAITSGPLVLIIEDDGQMRRFLRASLVTHGYRVVESSTGADGLAQASAHNPDLVLLDLGLPDIDGVVVTTRLREWCVAPVLVVSARGQEKDKIDALDAGADDYLTKPFGSGELMARIRVALRHAARVGDDDEPVVTIGEIKIDLARREVFAKGERVRLTPIEYKLLATLVKHAGRVMTHRQLLKEVWGPAHGQETQYLRVYMRHLRHKLEEDSARPRYFVTELGVGYRLRAE